MVLRVKRPGFSPPSRPSSVLRKGPLGNPVSAIAKHNKQILRDPQAPLCSCYNATFGWSDDLSLREAPLRSFQVGNGDSWNPLARMASVKCKMLLYKTSRFL